MTVSSTTTRAQFFGNTTTGPYTTGMNITDSSWIKVYRQLALDTSATLLTLTTDYTVSTGTNATITFVSTIAADTTITVVRSVPRTQTSDYVNNSDFSNSTIESSLDKLTFQIQEQDEKLARALKFSPSINNNYLNITIPTPEADNLIKWNSDGTAIENADLASAGVVALPVPVSQGGTGATTAADARANLGLGTTSSPTFAGVSLNNAGTLKFTDADSSNWVGFKAPATVSTNVTWTLPSTDGTNGQTFVTNGSGTLSWGSLGSGTVSSIATGTGLTGGTITTTGTISLNISGLTTDTTTDLAADFLPIYQNSSTSNKKILVGNLPININGLSTKATPDGAADFVPIYDVAGTANKKVLLNNLPVNINGLTEDVAPDINNDFLMTYDTSASTNKKVAPVSIGAGSGSAAPNLIVNPSFIMGSGITSLTTTTASYPDNTFLTNATYAGDKHPGIQWRALTNVGGNSCTLSYPNVIPAADLQSNMSPFFVGIRNASSAGKHGLIQWIDNAKTTAARSQTVTFTVYLKKDSGADSDIRMGIIGWTGTANSPTDPVSSWGSAGTNPTLAASHSFVNTPASLTVTNSWVKYTVTGTVGATATNIGVMIWRETGSTTDYAYISTPMLVVGTSAGSYYFEPELEISEAMRFFEVLGPRPDDSSTSGQCVGAGYCYSTTVARMYFNFKVPKVKTPTLSIPTPADFDVDIAAGPVAVTSAAGTLGYNDGAFIAWTVASGLTAGQGCIILRDSTSSYSGVIVDAQI